MFFFIVLYFFILLIFFFFFFFFAFRWQVVLNVTVEAGHSFGARKTFKYRYRLCDNAWHSVRANFFKDSVTLRVDSEQEAYGFNGAVNSERVWVEAPLYIGGLPGISLAGYQLRCYLFDFLRGFRWLIFVELGRHPQQNCAKVIFIETDISTHQENEWLCVVCT